MTESPQQGRPSSDDGSDLSPRERRVLDAVVRIYVSTAEPAGSRNIVRTFDLDVSAATVRNTMSDLEAKGYLFHPHTSAGRIPTDRAYRTFVDQLMHPARISEVEKERLSEELAGVGTSGVERLVRQAIRALGVLSQELGVAAAPRLHDGVLDRLELVRISSNKVLLVAQIRSGLIRTVYVDLPCDVPDDTLVTLTLLLNERLAGLTLREIRETVAERIRDAAPEDDPPVDAVLNIFMQSGASLFDWPEVEAGEIHIGNASVLAGQPEFNTGEGMKGLLELTERRDLLASALSNRSHAAGLQITIGSENPSEELAGFTLITSEYHLGDLKGVIGVIGPTRMPYEKVVAIVDYTSSLVNQMLSWREPG